MCAEQYKITGPGEDDDRGRRSTACVNHRKADASFEYSTVGRLEPIDSHRDDAEARKQLLWHPVVFTSRVYHHICDVGTVVWIVPGSDANVRPKDSHIVDHTRLASATTIDICRDGANDNVLGPDVVIR